MKVLRSRVIHTDSRSNKTNKSEQILHSYNILNSKTKRRKEQRNKKELDSKIIYDVSIDNKFQLQTNENSISMKRTLLNKKILRNDIKISGMSTSKSLERPKKDKKSLSNIITTSAEIKTNKNSNFINSVKISSKNEKANHKNYISANVSVDSDSKIITGIKNEGLSRKLTPISNKQYKYVNNLLNSKVMESKSKNNRKSNFSESNNSLDQFPTFKNIVTSTTIKPKKFKQNKKNGNKRSSKSKITSKESIKIDTSLQNSNIMNEIICVNNNSILLKNDISNNFLSGKNVSTINNMYSIDVLNSTYLKIDNETNVEVPKNPNEFSVSTTNNSGQWKVEDQNSIINISNDMKMNELNSNDATQINDAKKEILLDDLYISPPKSARKKWQRFVRNSQGANLILEQIGKPQENKNPQLLNKTANFIRRDQSINKKIVSKKRTEMPNFTLIHQKAYAKMESISEYSQRKRERANLLLTNKKIQFKKDKSIDKMTKLKNSRQLFTNQDKTESTKTKFNRFGFKLKTVSSYVPSSSNLQKQSQPLNQYIVQVKPSIYSGNGVLAISNKNVQNTGKLRENKRDILKGVRTNRRFELLMKMRNKY